MPSPVPPENNFPDYEGYLWAYQNPQWFRCSPNLPVTSLVSPLIYLLPLPVSKPQVSQNVGLLWAMSFIANHVSSSSSGAAGFQDFPCLFRTTRLIGAGREDYTQPLCYNWTLSFFCFWHKDHLYEAFPSYHLYEFSRPVMTSLVVWNKRYLFYHSLGSLRSKHCQGQFLLETFKGESIQNLPVDSPLNLHWIDLENLLEALSSF